MTPAFLFAVSLGLLNAIQITPRDTVSKATSTLDSKNVVDEFGFHYVAPPIFQPLDLAQVNSHVKDRASNDVTNKDEKLGIDCGRIVFLGKDGAGSVLELMEAPSICTGVRFDLQSVSKIFFSTEDDPFAVQHPQFGFYSIGHQRFAIMRSSATLKQYPSVNVIVEKVITIAPQGTVYWQGMFTSKKAADSFELSPIRFHDDKTSRLVPNTAFEPRP